MAGSHLSQTLDQEEHDDHEAGVNGGEEDDHDDLSGEDISIISIIDQPAITIVISCRVCVILQDLPDTIRSLLRDTGTGSLGP